MGPVVKEGASTRLRGSCFSVPADYRHAVKEAGLPMCLDSLIEAKTLDF